MVVLNDRSMSCKFSFKCVVIFIKIVVTLLLSRSFRNTSNPVTCDVFLLGKEGGRGDFLMAEACRAYLAWIVIYFSSFSPTPSLLLPLIQLPLRFTQATLG